MTIFDSIDEALTGAVGTWNIYSTGIATALVVVISYRIATLREPDTHPMLLARQAVPSPVRHEGESAIYRSQASPHSMPLNQGLNVKAAGAAKWSRGRDGNLKDVWRRFALGGEDGQKGKMYTVLGSQNVIEHKTEDITRQVNLIGKHISDQGGNRVAVYLPNSIELLTTLFACSFQQALTPVLIPFNVTSAQLVAMLRQSGADTLVTAPGNFSFDEVSKAYPSLRQVVWVVDQGSSHMDWNEVPEGTGGKVNVATWQDIINDASSDAGTELPEADLEKAPQDVVTFWQSKTGEMEEMVSFSQANLVAGMAGQIAAVPARDRFGPADLLVPADSLTNIHTLVLTLSAMYSSTSIALNSVAGRTADLALATQGVAPTIVVASPETLANVHTESTARLSSPLAKAAHSMSTRALTQEGLFNTSNFMSGFSAGAKPAVGNNKADSLRLVFAAERVGGGSPILSSQTLSDLRVFFGARIVYALSAPRVAGAVTQTAYFDYRIDNAVEAHFGGPATSVEVYFKDTAALKTTDENVAGQIHVRGPAVSGGEADLGVTGKLNEDSTLSYA